MPTSLSRPPNILAKVVHALGSLLADQRGTIAVMMAFLFPILVGGLGLGFEVSNWYLQTRAMQNAADSAALAAAANASPNYNVEAKAVAAQYGFVGSNNVTVTASNIATCPAGGNTCYNVTITSKVPLYLAQVVGYSGNTTVNGAKGQALSSTAVAQQTTKPQALCLLALATNGTALRTNGAPNSNFDGCSVMSDSASTCNGSNLNANYGLAHATNNGCGNKQDSNIPIVTDPYAYMAANIRPNTCSSYPQETKHGSSYSGGTSWKAGSSWPNSGTVTLSSYKGVPTVQICGDVQLTGNVTINAAAPGTVLVIENGQLDLNSYTLTTTNVTMVFSGTSGNYTHVPTDNSSGSLGVLNIIAPTSSSALFPGMAIYQDPSLTTGVDITYKGNNPDWKISGGVYLPNSNVQISGNVSQPTNSADCFVMVADTIWINGTSNIYQQSPDGSGCKQAGLNIPTATIPGRAQLVN